MLDARTEKRVGFALSRNRAQDNTEAMDELSERFRFEDAADRYWNPPEFSFLWGTPLWDGASPTQRLRLNQIFWVAYYSQIVSAEIATIFFNQICAAGLYQLEGFRSVCDTLDLETQQERAHIHAFRTVGARFEDAVFGRRLFTYEMRGPFVETMVHRRTGPANRFWRRLQLRAFTLAGSSSPFLACQYFTVRGLRTLNGKLIQHRMSLTGETDDAPIPARLSRHHFLDESFHFDTSTTLSRDILKSLRAPGRLERLVANRGILGTQRDHYSFSSAVNGLFWWDPALFDKTWFILRSPLFGFSEIDARRMMERCFGEEHEGLHASLQSRAVALQSYREYLKPLAYVDETNRRMAHMEKNNVSRHLAGNRRALRRFFA